MKSKLIIPLVILFVLMLGVSSITIVAFYTRDNNTNEKNNSNVISNDSKNESAKDETPSINSGTESPTETEENGIEVQEQTKVENKQQDDNLKYSSSNNSSSTKTNTSSSNNSSSNNTLNENKNSSSTTNNDVEQKPTKKGICTTNDSEYNSWLNKFLSENPTTRVFNSMAELENFGETAAKNYGFGYYFSPNPDTFEGTNCTKEIYTLQLYAAADDCGGNPFMYIPREQSLTDVYSYLRSKGYVCDEKTWFRVN